MRLVRPHLLTSSRERLERVARRGGGRTDRRGLSDRLRTVRPGQGSREASCILTSREQPDTDRCCRRLRERNAEAEISPILDLSRRSSVKAEGGRRRFVGREEMLRSLMLREERLTRPVRERPETFSVSRGLALRSSEVSHDRKDKLFGRNSEILFPLRLRFVRLVTKLRGRDSTWSNSF